MTNILSDYLSREELAVQLNKNTRTIARWEVMRTGPAVTYIGKTPYYRKTTVIDWLASQEQKPTRRTA